jgi:hypothetical protein
MRMVTEKAIVDDHGVRTAVGGFHMAVVKAAVKKLLFLRDRV